MLLTCNHHKADTRIVLHKSISIEPVIITATDTDVLVVLTHAYPQCNNSKQWLMKTNPGKFIDIKTICNFFGNGICQILPGFYSITGCDRTSYPFGVGKISPFKKIRRFSKMYLLQDLRKNNDSFKLLDKPKLFFQTILCSGKEIYKHLFGDSTWRTS